MSSSGPYQSRLLNFLNRQTLKARDRLTYTARHLKIAVEWSVQILVYPFYLLVQTGRMAGQQLENAEAQTRLLENHHPKPQSSPEIPVDQPLERVLRTVDLWIASLDQVNSPPLLEATQPLSLTVRTPYELTVSATTTNLVTQVKNKLKNALTSVNTGKLVIHGVGTSLETRRLVLTTLDNQTLDILSARQQRELQKRIRTETATFYYERRLQKLTGKRFPGLIPALNQQPKTVLPPIRWFWQAMRWMQTSEVAVNINLFGEASLVSLRHRSAALVVKNHPFNLSSSSSEHFSHNQETLQALIRSAMDYFLRTPKNALPQTVAIVTQNLSKAAEISQHKLVKPLNHQIQHWGQHLSQHLEIDPHSNPFQIQAIIYAAIEHFWGQLPPSQLMPPQPATTAIADPWLSPEDLFPPPVPETVDILVVSPPSLSASQSTQTLTKKAKIKQDIVQENPQPSQISLSSLEDHSLTQTVSSTETEIDPQWLEADSQVVGYVKHPLVQILELLDRLILGIEEIIVKILHKIRQLVKQS